ncbi:hypothetical protein [Peribacillus phoenicis]|uniref:hypothetical protein n=1 Tax=Peribacillus sp. 1P06PA-2 TaxID=3132295 RepID=UPI0039A6A2A2
MTIDISFRRNQGGGRQQDMKIRDVESKKTIASIVSRIPLIQDWNEIHINSIRISFQIHEMK